MHVYVRLPYLEDVPRALWRDTVPGYAVHVAWIRAGTHDTRARGGRVPPSGSLPLPLLKSRPDAFFEHRPRGATNPSLASRSSGSRSVSPCIFPIAHESAVPSALCMPGTVRETSTSQVDGGGAAESLCWGPAACLSACACVFLQGTPFSSHRTCPPPQGHIEASRISDVLTLSRQMTPRFEATCPSVRPSITASHGCAQLRVQMRTISFRTHEMAR